MKPIVTAVAWFLFLTAPALAGELLKLSLDDPATMGLKIASDSQIKVEGNGSIRIVTLWPTTVCLGEVSALKVENAKLIYRARVRSQLEGTAFLELWAHVGGGQYFSRGMNDPIQGTSDWTSIQTPFMFQTGQNPDKVTLNLVINGKGTVWIDDIVLLKESLK